MTRLDMTVPAFVSTITGSERGMIARYYKVRFDELQKGDRFIGLEALAFVHQFRDLKRDRDAYAAAQALTIEELADYFVSTDEDVDEEAADAEAAGLARWCLITGRSTTEYLGLDERHRRAFINQAIELGLAKVKEDDD